MKKLIKRFIPDILLNWYHLLFPTIGALIYGFPSKKLIVIGVAGTDGKTTVVNLIASVLEEAGYKVAFSSTIKFKIGSQEWPNTLKMTMPGRFKLQKFLRQAVKADCRYAILEVTDEGIKQHRHRFIDFQVAVLTNITPEHIEAHGSFEKMREMNGKLFQATKGIHIINCDDPNVEYFLQFPAAKKVLYSLRDKSMLLHSIKLLGEFNLYNALAAIQVGLSQGINLEICQRAIEKVEKIPGRMEKVIQEPFVVIVDYAHTPNALQSVYKALKPKIKRQASNNLICVLGACGGGRDKWKRAEFGKIAAEYCDQIIITNEDPYDENPNQILSEIKSGVSNSPARLRRRANSLAGGQFLASNLYEILDRREAIRKALILAKPGDTVIITGKGSEPWICVNGGKKIPWDDRKIVKEVFASLK